MSEAMVKKETRYFYEVMYSRERYDKETGLIEGSKLQTLLDEGWEIKSEVTADSGEFYARLERTINLK